MRFCIRRALSCSASRRCAPKKTARTPKLTTRIARKNSAAPPTPRDVLPRDDCLFSVFRQRFNAAGENRANRFDLISIENHGFAAAKEHAAAAKRFKFIKLLPAVPPEFLLHAISHRRPLFFIIPYAASDCHGSGGKLRFSAGKLLLFSVFCKNRAAMGVCFPPRRG